MQREPREIVGCWLEQARAELEAGERNLDRPFLACFLAQQSADKALKALVFWRNGQFNSRDSIATLLDQLPSNSRDVSPMLRTELRALDKYYTKTRYPDPPDYAVPAASFSSEEAGDALGTASCTVALVAVVLNSESAEPGES